MVTNETAAVRFQRLRIAGLPCVVTNRTGAGWRLYIITSFDARLGTVRRPVGVFKDRPSAVRCLAEFTPIKQSVHVQ